MIAPAVTFAAPLGAPGDTSPPRRDRSSRRSARRGGSAGRVQRLGAVSCGGSAPPRRSPRMSACLPGRPVTSRLPNSSLLRKRHCPSTMAGGYAISVACELTRCFRPPALPGDRRSEGWGARPLDGGGRGYWRLRAGLVIGVVVHAGRAEVVEVDGARFLDMNLPALFAALPLPTGFPVRRTSTATGSWPARASAVRAGAGRAIRTARAQAREGIMASA